MTKPFHKQEKMGAAVQLDLRILATTDLHACLTAWDYYAHKPADERGLSRLATLIRTAQAEVANSLLFDNGDFLAGSGIGDLWAERFPSRDVHPMVAAMNALQFDAVNLGNHEFSHGLAFLRHALKDALFPIVCTNFTFHDLPFVQQSLLISRALHDSAGKSHRITVGVIGLLPAQTMVWEAIHLKGHASAAPMLQRAQSAAAELRSKGADLVVALSHTGLALQSAESSAGEEHFAQAVAAISGIDVVIAGHSHQKFPAAGEGADSAMVLPGFFGSHLGVVDLTLQHHGDGWKVAAHRAELRPIAQRDSTGKLAPLVSDVPEIRALAEPAHAAIIEQATKVIGQTHQRLHSYFATVTSAAALALIAQAQETALAAHLAGTQYAGLPILSAVAPFKAGGRGGPENYTDLAIGPLLHHHAADLYMHPNRLIGFRVTGAEVALWLERAVSKYFQITAGMQDAPLLNPDFPSFNCDMIFGLTYEIDLHQPPMFNAQGAVVNPMARRIINLRHNGAPLRDDQVFALASNSYRREGKSGFAGTSQTHVIADSPLMIQTLLRSYIAENRQMPQPGPQHWRFAPVQGATVWVASSPTAMQVLDDIAHFRPLPLGLDEAGFLRFRLHL